MFVVNRASDKYKSLNIEANRPDITMPIKEKNQYDEDITVILSFSRCLEGLPHDRLPNESDLKHPIKQIEGAINRQKANPKIPEHLRQTLLLSETFLALYKN